MLLTTFVSSFTYAAGTEFIWTLNGKPFLISDYGNPYINKGIIMIPLAGASKLLGLEAKYVSSDQSIHIPVHYLNGDIVFTLNSPNISLPSEISTESIKMDAKTVSLNGRAYVPLRYLFEILGYEVKVKEENNKYLVDIVDYYPKVLRKIDYNTPFKFEVNGKDYTLPEEYGPAFRVSEDKGRKSLLMLPAIPLAEEFGYEIKVDDKNNFTVHDVETNGKYDMKYTLSDKITDVGYDNQTFETQMGKNVWYDNTSSFRLGYLDEKEVLITNNNIFISIEGLKQIFSKRNYFATSDNDKMIKGFSITESFGIGKGQWIVVLEDPLRAKRPFLSKVPEFYDWAKNLKDSIFFNPIENEIKRTDLEYFGYKKNTFGNEISYYSFDYGSPFIGDHITLYFDKGLNNENKEVLKRLLMTVSKDGEAIYNLYIEMYNFYYPKGGSIINNTQVKPKDPEWASKNKEYYSYYEYCHTVGNTTFKLSPIDIYIREKVNNPR